MAVLRRPAARGVAAQGAPPGRGVMRRPAAREGERGRTPPPPRPVGPLPAGVLLGCVGGRLLWGPCQVGGTDSEGRARQKRRPHSAPPHRDRQRTSPENLHVGQGHALQAARVPGGARSSGERRLLRARSQRTPGESRRRGRMGEQPRRTGDRGSGRDGGLEEEGAGAPASAPPPTGGGCGSARRRREGPGAREKEEGKEEEDNLVMFSGFRVSQMVLICKATSGFSHSAVLRLPAVKTIFWFITPNL